MNLKKKEVFSYMNNDIKDSKVLITGASGFLGKSLSAALSKLGYEILALDSKRGNISDPHYFDAFLQEDVSYVFHLAANTFVPYSWELPHKFIETNVLGTLQVMEFCRKKAIPVTYVSAYIYGRVADMPISEAVVPHPNNPYALSKKMGEDVCRFYIENHQQRVKIVRPFNIYGPGQPHNFLIPALIRQALDGTTITVKDLRPKRDYIHVNDVVDILVKTMAYESSDVFNAGSGVSYTVKEVVEVIEQLLNKKLIIKSTGEERVNEILDTVADISKAKQLLNWDPAFSLSRGLEQVLSEYL